MAAQQGKVLEGIGRLESRPRPWNVLLQGTMTPKTTATKATNTMTTKTMTTKATTTKATATKTMARVFIRTVYFVSRLELFYKCQVCCNLHGQLNMVRDAYLLQNG